MMPHSQLRPVVARPCVIVMNSFPRCSIASCQPLVSSSAPGSAALGHESDAAAEMWLLLSPDTLVPTPPSRMSTSAH
jgi:hypothetical protein